MLKHVHLSPLRSSLVRSGKADTVSLNSSMSFSSLGQEFGLSSRSSSYTSLNDTTGSAPPTIPVKVFTKCLRPDLEYKTLGITYDTTCRQLVTSLLSKYRMKHRDPKLFYLAMEVGIRNTGTQVKTILMLDAESCPAQLQACYPRGDSRFTLKMRPGGLVKIYDSILMSGSQYKSLLVSERTTVDDMIQLLLSCYNFSERVDRFSLYEVSTTVHYERKLHPDDCPLLVQREWLCPSDYHLVLRRNCQPLLPRRLLDKRKSPWGRHVLTPNHVLEEPSSNIQTPVHQMSSSSYNDYENYFYI